MQAVRATLATPPMPGAVAIIDLYGEDVTPILSQITGIATWQSGVVRLTDFAGIDQGLAVCINENHAQLMPHAGPRVVQRMMAKLIELGAEASEHIGFAGAGGECSYIEFAVLSRIWDGSPAAIDLLLAQPRLWREWLAANREPSEEAIRQIFETSRNLDRLLTPPSVVVVGSPNVGKSTLSNTILGRVASIVADMPGTTRDFVSSPAELDGVAIQWLDTPGLRITADSVESEAIALAWNVLEKADVLIGMRDAEHGWPDAYNLPRKPDLHVITKCDRGVTSLPDDPPDVIRLSAHTGAGVDELTQKVLAKLGLSRADRTPRPWAFSMHLRRTLMERDWKFLRRYLLHE